MATGDKDYIDTAVRRGILYICAFFAEDANNKSPFNQTCRRVIGYLSQTDYEKYIRIIIKIFNDEVTNSILASWGILKNDGNFNMNSLALLKIIGLLNEMSELDVRNILKYSF